MFQAQIDALTPETITIAHAATPSLDALEPYAAAAAIGRRPPSNAELIAQMKDYYKSNKLFVDTMATKLREVPHKAPDQARALSERKWTDSNKNPLPLDGSMLKAAADIKGIFDERIASLDPSHMFTTMGIGAGIDAQFLVGGAGGVGAAWDITEREPKSGYAYAMVEMGLRVDASVNVQGLFVNKLPSELTHKVLGMKVSAAAGLGLSLTVFWNADPRDALAILGFAVGIEVGGGAGATIAYGKLWGF